jgi:hypothetical protein
MATNSTLAQLIPREVTNVHYRRESFRLRGVQVYVTEATSVYFYIVSWKQFNHKCVISLSTLENPMDIAREIKWHRVQAY